MNNINEESLRELTNEHNLNLILGLAHTFTGQNIRIFPLDHKGNFLKNYNFKRKITCFNVPKLFSEVGTQIGIIFGNNLHIYFLDIKSDLEYACFFKFRIRSLTKQEIQNESL